jgi:hypothetical protein
MAKKAKEPVRATTEDGVLKVVSAAPSGNEVRVIVEGTNLERLSSPEARKLAYEQRFAVGMANAGVSPVAGTFVPDEEYEAAAKDGRDVARWQREFRLINMI